MSEEENNLTDENDFPCITKELRERLTEVEKGVKELNSLFSGDKNILQQLNQHPSQKKQTSVAGEKSEIICSELDCPQCGTPDAII